MFCPKCKAEYRAGFVRCTDCGVALEVSAPRAIVPDMPVVGSHGEPSAVLWRGQDPVSFSVVLSALDDEGIFYKELQRRDYAAALSQPFALSFYGLPHWEVRVCATDLGAAQKIAEEALRPISALTVEANYESASGNSDRAEIDSSEIEKQLNAPVKIWSGDDVDLAGQLLEALVNQEIRCWTISSFPSGEDLLVRQENEERARAILRGVLERTSAA